MKKIIIALVMFVLAGMNAPAMAGIQEVSIRVDGLACPFCAYGLEKKLKKTGKLKNYDVDFEKGLVSVGYSGKTNVTLESFKRAVKDAGFSYMSMSITATGTLKEIQAPDGSKANVVEDADGFRVLLLSDSGDTHLQALKEAGRNKMTGVTVSGPVHEELNDEYHGASEFAIFLKSFELQNEKKEKK